MDFLRWFKDKAQALRVALQAGKAREFAEFKRAARPKKSKNTKPVYEPGTLGLSAVSASIKKEHGVILSRRERKQKAREAFKRHYNN
ncbi:hypothetical protein A8F94_17370 [Bacillus sp. FJAT-27225]|uniref:hypothetical protein n=1 Tax=Bacillus sp. FJAT-27225 TaxID=1743144 RepID=UPI00080C2AEF|nr:hypothetical protein [Bacillus sp. FJAT-27225]OCA84467.1 hypothetical protein A8F94_17370 [Bacillus sp. FJAT-27225]